MLRRSIETAPLIGNWPSTENRKNLATTRPVREGSGSGIGVLLFVVDVFVVVTDVLGDFPAWFQMVGLGRRP